MIRKTFALIAFVWLLSSASLSYSSTWVNNTQLLQISASSEDDATVYRFVFQGEIPTDSCDVAYVSENVLMAVILVSQGEPPVVAQHIYSTALAADTQHRMVDLLIDQAVCEQGYGFVLEGIRVSSPAL